MFGDTSGCKGHCLSTSTTIYSMHTKLKLLQAHPLVPKNKTVHYKITLFVALFCKRFSTHQNISASTSRSGDKTKTIIQFSLQHPFMVCFQTKHGTHVAYVSVHVCAKHFTCCERYGHIRNDYDDLNASKPHETRRMEN